MDKNLKEIFQKIKPNSKTDLVEHIWSVIVTREKKAARLKFWLFSFLGICSLTGLVPAFKILTTDLAHSGFYEYASLSFSKGGFLSAYWKEFSILIVESLPIISIALSLSLVFFFFLSLRFILKQNINNQLSLN